MNPPQGFSIVRVLLLLAVCVQAPVAAAQQKQKSALQFLAEMVKEAVEELVEEAVEEVVDEPVAIAMPAAVAAPEKEVKQRLERLNAWSKAMQDWVAVTAGLSDEQKKFLQTDLKAAVDKAQKDYGKGGNAAQMRMNQGLTDFFPIRMTSDNGAADKLDVTRFPKNIPSVKLSKEQQAKLDNAAAKRRKFQADAALGRVLNLIDRELFLTATQRAELGPAIRSRNSLTAQCYAFHPQNYYFQQTSVLPFIQAGPHLKMLNEAQQTRAADMSQQNGGSYNNERYILFQSNEGVDTWQDKLSEASKNQKKRLQRACAVRVAFYKSEHELPEKQARRLVVAGKGTVDEVVAAWKTQSRKQLKSFEDQAMRARGGNFSFGLNVADIHKIEQAGLWKTTLTSIAPDFASASSDRDSARRSAMTNFVVSLVDHELWLTADQRAKLTEKLGRQMPAPDYRNNYQYFEEITLLAVALFKCSKQDLAILSDSQKAAWETIKKQMPFDGRYVRVPMKHGGQMSFRIPD